MKINQISQSKLLKITLLSFFLAGCSSSVVSTQGERFSLLPADEMMQGPGIFSGEKGEFYIVGGDKKVAPEPVSKPVISSKSVRDMDLNQTSKVLDERIRQLQRDQMELELLKREINKKIQN